MIARTNSALLLAASHTAQHMEMLARTAGAIGQKEKGDQLHQSARAVRELIDRVRFLDHELEAAQFERDQAKAQTDAA